MIDSLGNLELDSEYLASQIIRGVLFSENYILCRAQFCNMPLIDFIPEIFILQNAIKKELVAPFGTIQDKPLEKFLSGENDGLLDAVIYLKQMADTTIPTYQQALVEAFEDITKELEINMSGQDFLGMGQAIQIAAAHKSDLDHIRQSDMILRKLSGSCENLIAKFGTVTAKLNKKRLKVGNNNEYKFFISDLMFHPEYFSGNMSLGVVMGHLLDTIKSALPTGEVFDPYKLDEMSCILDALSYPKDFYSMCENDSIVSPAIGEKFGKCYPEYWKKFVDMYLHKYENMDYEKQLKFRKCFGLRENNSQLIQFVTGALSVVV